MDLKLRLNVFFLDNIRSFLQHVYNLKKKLLLLADSTTKNLRYELKNHYQNSCLLIMGVF